MTNWSNRITGYKQVPVNELLANPANARRHPPQQRDALRGSLDALGFVSPVIVNADGYLLDGHARVEELLTKDENALIPVIEVDLTEDEANLFLASFDWITSLATYDRDSLDSLLQSVNTDNEALQTMLAGMAEAHDLYFGGEPVIPVDMGAQVDRADELQAKWQVKKGDLWVIGRHWLLCGDSTNAADVAKVLQDEQIDLVFTDPPYNLQHYGGGFSSKEIRQDFKNSLAPLTIFNPSRFLSQLDRVEWSNSIIFCSKDLLPDYFEWARNYDFNLFVWYKTNPPPFTNNTFLPDLEYMVVAHKPNKVFTNGLSYQEYSRVFISDIHAGKDAVLASHPTMKPLDLIVRYTRVLSGNDGVIYDAFGGSGTTMVACEQLSRQCRMIEIEPKYCAVILERMASLGCEPRKL